MKARLLRGAGVRRRAARIALASIALAAPATSAGCLDRPVAPITSLTTSTETDVLKQTSVDKIDMLLMIDNSASMADKQAVLAAAVPDLVTGILNPSCVDSGGTPVGDQPKSPTDPCPGDSQREFPPVLDIHVGVITSSLGTFGAYACTPPEATCPDENDMGHLVTRTTACSATGSNVPTYQQEGFLAWDPSGQDKPAGIADLGTFSTYMTDLVSGTGQDGCGFEQQNEAWYRFLIEPAPYGNVTFQNYQVQKSGMDQALLDERAQFLRPDSLLAIIVLTDETDVSIKEESYYPLLAENQIQLPNARSECATNPADPCCSSCGLDTPPSCPDESGPGQPCETGNMTNGADNAAIRAFGLSNGEQSLKARYGIDFLYPTSRYVAALTQTTLSDSAGNSFPNPLLAQRDPSLLFYATITGVPWKLIARDTSNLANGFKTPAELAQMDPTGKATYWDDIAGDPDNYVPPLSPFMQESDSPRHGTDPITGIAITTTTRNPLNGHEWMPAPLANYTGTGDSRGDLEYACVFPLPLAMQKDCSGPNVDTATCNCADDDANSNATNPLCDPTTPTTQIAAKAYPGVRNLAIVKGMYDANPKSGGIVASICPEQFDQATDPTTGLPEANYGYRPAVAAIVNRLKLAIHNQCLSSALPTVKGTAPCIVLEAQPAGGDCGCTATARAKVPEENQQAVTEAQQLAPSTEGACFCEITQTTGTELTACQSDAMPPAGVDGWCYLDATSVPPIGEPALLSSLLSQCPATEQRQVHFVGKGQPLPNAQIFVTCEGQ